MGGAIGHRRHQRGGRGARADHHHPLAADVEVVGPFLRVDDAALEIGQARPFRRVAALVAVVALAHPEEAGGEADRLAVLGPDGVDRPEILRAGPGGGRDRMAVADMAGEVVLGDHLAHVAQDFLGGRDRRPGPGLEAIAEGVEVAVGADAGVAVRAPGAAEPLAIPARRSWCRGIASPGGRRRRRRRCRRPRSARRNARRIAGRRIAGRRWRSRLRCCPSGRTLQGGWRRCGRS